VGAPFGVARIWTFDQRLAPDVPCRHHPDQVTLGGSGVTDATVGGDIVVLAAFGHHRGVETIDAAGLSRARELEAFGFLQLTLAMGEKTGGFGVVR